MRVEARRCRATRGRSCRPRPSPGDPFEFDLAAGIAALDGPAALAALDVIEQRGLVRGTEDPRCSAFRHPVVRSAVHGRSAPALAGRPRGGGAGARTRRRAVGLRAQHLAHAAAVGDVDAAATLRRPPRASASRRRRRLGLAAGRAAGGAAAVERGARRDLVEAGGWRRARRRRRGEAAGPADRVVGASVERMLGPYAAARRRLLRRWTRARPALRWRRRVLADLAGAAYRVAIADARLGAADRPADPDDGAVRAGRRCSRSATRRRRCRRRRRIDLDALAAVDAAGDDELAAAAEPVEAVVGLLAVEAARRAPSPGASPAAAPPRNGIASIPHDLAAVLALGLLGRLTEAQRSPTRPSRPRA